MAKKLYNIQLRNNKDSDQNSNLFWFSPIEARAVSNYFVEGYIACSQSHYPSPDIRVIDHFSGEIVKELKGNGQIVTNKE